jgi:hypothetical protein
LQSILIGLNVFAMLLLSGMSDVAPATRVEVAAVVAANLVCLAGTAALASRPARWGAAASVIGYLSAVALWLVLVMACGIEYFNARCDAIVDPAIAVALVFGLASLPIGRVIGLMARR